MAIDEYLMKCATLEWISYGVEYMMNDSIKFKITVTVL